MVQPTRQRILDCALTLFGRHGVSEVSMEMVAAETGLTRQAIYRYFRDRNTLFIEAARSLHVQAIEAAEAAALQAARAGRSLAETLADVFDARHTPFVERLEQSRHADEMLEVNAKLVGDVAAEYEGRLLGLLTRLIAAERGSGGFEPLPHLSEIDLAQYLMHAVRGLKAAPTSRKLLTFRRDMRVLVKLIVRGASVGASSQ